MLSDSLSNLVLPTPLPAVTFLCRTYAYVCRYAGLESEDHLASATSDEPVEFVESI